MLFFRVVRDILGILRCFFIDLTVKEDSWQYSEKWVPKSYLYIYSFKKICVDMSKSYLLKINQLKIMFYYCYCSLKKKYLSALLIYILSSRKVFLRPCRLDMQLNSASLTGTFFHWGVWGVSGSFSSRPSNFSGLDEVWVWKWFSKIIFSINFGITQTKSVTS